MKKYSLLLALMLVLGTMSAQAAIYLKIDGVPGESKDSDHRDWIQAQSFNWEAHKSFSEGDSSTFRQREIPLEMGGFVITKNVDKSSPKLAELLAKGSLIKDLDIHTTKGDAYDGDNIPYLIYNLSNARVKSYSISARGDDTPIEQIEFVFDTIEMNYGEKEHDGTIKSFIRWVYTSLTK